MSMMSSWKHSTALQSVLQVTLVGRQDQGKTQLRVRRRQLLVSAMPMLSARVIAFRNKAY